MVEMVMVVVVLEQANDDSLAVSPRQPLTPPAALFILQAPPWHRTMQELFLPHLHRALFLVVRPSTVTTKHASLKDKHETD